MDLPDSVLDISDIDSSWKALLREEFRSPAFAQLNSFITSEKTYYEIYPNDEDIFAAFRLTAFKEVKVVILGQDPYHGAGQAHGLAFSVKKGVPLPPSLVNIFKELQDDLGCKPPKEGDLTAWAREGVLLLNTVLTVRAREPHSHRGRGWEDFTDAVIRKLSQHKKSLVFILWGKPAQSKKKLIDRSKHLVLEGPHPSPLSSYRGFFGSRPFSKSNDFLLSHGISPVNWQL